jgi:hypothetical protein
MELEFPTDLVGVRKLASEFEGFDDRMIRRWITQSLFPVYRLGGRVWISRADFATWLAKNRHGEDQS